MTRSGPRLVSPVADRDLLVFAALLVLAAAAMVVTVLLVLAAGIAAALLGAPVQLTPDSGWITTGVRILADADDPGRHLRPALGACPRRAPPRLLDGRGGAAGAGRGRLDPGRRA